MLIIESVVFLLSNKISKNHLGVYLMIFSNFLTQLWHSWIPDIYIATLKPEKVDFDAN